MNLPERHYHSWDLMLWTDELLSFKCGRCNQELDIKRGFALSMEKWP